MHTPSGSEACIIAQLLRLEWPPHRRSSEAADAAIREALHLLWSALAPQRRVSVRESTPLFNDL